MTRCQSELDPVVVARCDARRRREEETGWARGDTVRRLSRRVACFACERPPVSRSAVLGIREDIAQKLPWGGAGEGLQMAMLRCRGGRLSMFCSEPCMSGASRFRPSEVL